DDALGGIIGEVGIGFVLRHPVVVAAAIGLVIEGLGEHVVLALIAITNIAQANRGGHVLQFAVAIGGAGQTIQRMVGDVQLHHTLANLFQPVGLGVDHEAVHGRR